MENIEKAYTAKEVRTTLDIGDSTLRKWCLALEKCGYQFFRNDQNRRLFIEKDIVVLRHFQALVQDNNMPLENAANIIVSRFGDAAFEQRTVIVPSDQNNTAPEKIEDTETVELLHSLIDYMVKQEQFNKELLERLEKQQEYIEKQQAYIEEQKKYVEEQKEFKEYLNERLEERDKKLMETLRVLQENKHNQLQKTPATKDSNDHEPKKGFFARLFRK